MRCEFSSKMTIAAGITLWKKFQKYDNINFITEQITYVLKVINESCTVQKMKISDDFNIFDIEILLFQIRLTFSV